MVKNLRVICMTSIFFCMTFEFLYDIIYLLTYKYTCAIHENVLFCKLCHEVILLLFFACFVKIMNHGNVDDMK